MQLLRAARAACTNPHFQGTSIGSSLSLGPIFSTVATTWREARLVTGENPVLLQARNPSCRRRETRLVAGEQPVLSQLQPNPAYRPLIEIV